MPNIFSFTRTPNYIRVVELLLTLRALLFVGTRYECPCCGWGLRAFTRGGISLTSRPNGYCPRCNAKARHRRIWLFLKDRTNLFSEQLSLFHVGPKYSLSRRFATMPNLDYVSVDLRDRPHIKVRMDIARTSIASNTFDCVICIHVLEHIAEDRRSIDELYRILKPGGWAIITVPIRLDQETYEDSSITMPEERKEAFGETDHVRIYGLDFIDRLEECGFQVQLDLAKDVDTKAKEKYGLLDDENIFLCSKGDPKEESTSSLKGQVSI